MSSAQTSVSALLPPKVRLVIYLASWAVTKGLAAALAALVIFGDAPKWYLAISAAWGVLNPTEGLAIANVPKRQDKPED